MESRRLAGHQNANHSRPCKMSNAPAKKPHIGVGVGCLITRGDRLLFVRSRHGYWSPPGGKLQIGEAIEDCAAREVFEETGLRVRDLAFVALTNDIFPQSSRHDLTIWMRGEAEPDALAEIQDPTEITGLEWFPRYAFPTPLHLDITNLLTGRSWPPQLQNLPLIRPRTFPT